VCQRCANGVPTRATVSVVRDLPQEPIGDCPTSARASAPSLGPSRVQTWLASRTSTQSCPTHAMFFSSVLVAHMALVATAPAATASVQSSDSRRGSSASPRQQIPFLGTFTVDDADGQSGTGPIDLSATAEKLISELSWEDGVDAVNATLGVTATHSFHMFATNRTETCHYHPGTTVSTVLWGHGRFFSTNAKSSPQAQPTGSVFVIPPGSPHAFGHVGMPTIVTVAWSPPHHANYTIPTTGCVGLYIGQRPLATSFRRAR
jgi:hypothetical protein